MKHHLAAALMLVPLLQSGCSSGKEELLGYVGNYKEILERQRMGTTLDESMMPNLSDMTAGEYEQVGDNYILQGNVTMAFMQYNKGLASDATKTSLRYKLAVLYLRKGLPEDARGHFQEILKQEPGNAAALEGLGEAFLQSNDPESAEKHFRQALAADADRWKARNFLGLIYDQQKRYPDAIAEYEKAILLRPRDPRLRNNIGLSYLLNAEYDKAIAALDQAVQLGGKDSRTYNNLALAFGKAGRYPDAWEAFRKGSNAAMAYNNVGIVYLEQGRHDKASACFQKAVETSPSYYEKAKDNMNRTQTGPAGNNMSKASCF